MGLFSRASSSADFPWTNITSIDQLDQVLASPSENAKVFFKHSTRCSISSMALRGFERTWETEGTGFELYFIDLIAHRDVSNAIAEKLKVTHQSPQAIVTRNGEVIYDASHHGIDAEKIQQLV